MSGKDHNGSALYRKAIEHYARSHVLPFADVSDIYNMNVHECCLVQLTDNCNINKLIDELFEVLHLGYLDHKLNLYMKNVVENNVSLSSSVRSIHETVTH